MGSEMCIRDRYDTCVSVCWNPTFQLLVFCSACCCCLQLRTLLLCVCETLLCMFGHDVYKRLRLHQQECGSAAAAPTARMRLVQPPMLHISSSISRDYVISVVVLCALRYAWVCVLELHISAFVIFGPACCCLQLRTLLLSVCGSLLCMFGHDVRVHALCVLRVRTATLQPQSHSKFVWSTSMRVLKLNIYAHV